MTEKQQLAMLVDFRARLRRAIEQSDRNIGDGGTRMTERHYIGNDNQVSGILTTCAWEMRNTGLSAELTPLSDLIDDLSSMIDVLSQITMPLTNQDD